MMGILKTVRWKIVAPILLVPVLIFVAFGLVDSALTDHRLAEQQTIIDNYARTKSIDQAQEKILAEAYWRRNRDVAVHEFFGVDGPLGVFGPREHFNRHGRLEGRVWGRSSLHVRTRCNHL